MRILEVVVNRITKLHRLITIISIVFFLISCDDQNNPPEKVELQSVSLFTDTDPPKIFILTLEAKTDTTLKLVITIPEEEAVEPAVNLRDTITKYRYQVNEVFIDSLNGNLYTSQIICMDSKKIIKFRSRAIDAIKIAKTFNAPVVADKKFLHKSLN